MEFVKVELSVPKESKELVDALAAIAEHFLAGHGIAEASLLLPALLVAAQGADQIPAEVKSASKGELACYLVKRILGALEVKKAPPPPKAA